MRGGLMASESGLMVNNPALRSLSGCCSGDSSRSIIASNRLPDGKGLRFVDKRKPFLVVNRNSAKKEKLESSAMEEWNEFCSFPNKKSALL
ncbi:hypothetical protein CDAR_316401 [Caerostris darwini]|uniref:Uncharacterized protein n=1 Tax=Caerostris darwini TaxID=1538125 RepID=A0AAV4ULK8_9ARAC|nr:hypothetical protein CDAR_316401 [Caerostris darwini]